MDIAEIQILGTRIEKRALALKLGYGKADDKTLLLITRRAWKYG